MGWGTTFTPNIYITREQFNSIGELRDTVDELRDTVKDYTVTLGMYISANPKDIIPDEWKEQGVEFIQFRLNEIIELYEADLIRLHKLELLLEFCTTNAVEPSKLKS